MNYEERLITILKNDPNILAILKAVEALNLPDCWICAGILRNKVWDFLHNTETPINDIDVIYYDVNDISIVKEQFYETLLHTLIPNLPWSVKNQARMHKKNNLAPYQSSSDGIRHFPETATAIGARMINNEIEIIAPHGLSDLFELKICPSPNYLSTDTLHPIFLRRVENKKWETIWTNLILIK